MTTEARTDIGPVALRPREVHFDWDAVPLHWIPGEPIASHVISAINLLLPAGERMFVATFKEALGHVSAEDVREAMVGFMGQEAVHAETHDQLLWQFLDSYAIDPRPFVAQIDWLFESVIGLGDHLPGAARTTNARTMSMVQRLGFIAGVEHFTAVLGDWILNADLEALGADPTMLDLFRWHGAEEVEHRCVAHDVASYFGVGYVQRNISFAIGAIGLLVLLLRGAKYLIRHDPSLPDYGYPALLVGMTRAMGRGALPKWRTMGASVLRYIRPGYTPEVEGNTAQAAAYLARSPGALSA